MDVALLTAVSLLVVARWHEQNLEPACTDRPALSSTR